MDRAQLCRHYRKRHPTRGLETSLVTTQAESASGNRRDVDPSECLIANTAASRNDLIGLAPPRLACLRQSGGLVCTHAQYEPANAVKYLYFLSRNSPQGSGPALLMEAEQYAVGLPGGTAASFVGWPEMWEHPEREDQLPNQVFPPSVPETEETRSWEGFIHAYGSFSIHRGVPKERFSELLKVWKAEIQLISNTNEICTHPAYQQIIGMGPLALPVIFGEMHTEP